MAEHPILTVILAFIAGSVVTSPFRYGFRAYNRHLRSKNIAAQGWPPEHLDADGDFKKTE
jgi:hypothetical protein